MRRTTHIGRKWKRLCRFCTEHRRMLFYIVLFAAGVWGGSSIRLSLLQSVLPMDAIESVTGTFFDGFSQILSSWFLPEILLLILFLVGLSAWATPITIMVPLFYGLGLGMTQAYCITQMDSGFLVSLLWIWPHSLIEITALLLGCLESLRLSLIIGTQLIPGGTIGSLWRDFRLYLLRFLWCSLIAFVAATVDVLLRMFVPLIN